MYNLEKLKLTKKELQALNKFIENDYNYFKRKLVYECSYENFFKKIGFHRIKKKLSVLFKNRGYLFPYEYHTACKKGIEEGYFYYKYSPVKNNGESYNVLYITERGVDLFFELLEEEIKLRLGEKIPIEK